MTTAVTVATAIAQPPLRFFVAGEPVGKGNMIQNAHGAIYDKSKNLKPWGDSVTWHAMQALGDQQPLVGPVRIRISAYFTRPKSHYGTGRNAQTLKPLAPTFHTAKPDSDKVARSVLDALTVARVWHDDKQVADLRVVKHWAEMDEPPGVLLVIRALGLP